MISLVIPTLNEVENIEPLVARVRQCQPAPDELLFVDDGSTDGTRESIRSIADSIPIEIVEREAPSLGLAGAVVAGARAAIGEWLVVMDADLSHPPEKISDLLRPLIDGEADLVIGSRYVKGGSTPGWPIWRKVLSRVAAVLAYPLTGVHDSMGGFFAIRRQLLLELASSANGFKIVFEVLVQGGSDLRVVEVPIVFHDRSRGVSKMSLGVASLFVFRWLLAMARRIFPNQEMAPRFSRHNSLARPIKSSKVATSALP